MIWRFVSASLVTALLSACSAVKDYDDVAETVRRQTGGSLVHPSGNLSENDVRSSVAVMLARPLTANSAAQIALLKSRRVRGTLEELNLSQADLLEASLPSNPTLAASVRWPRGGGGTNSEFGLAGDAINLLLLPLRRRLALREYEGAKRRISHELLEVVFETKKAFYEYQGAEQMLAKLQAAYEVNKLTGDIAKRLRDAGNITALELLQEQTSAQQAAVDITRAKGEAAAAREKVNRILGLSGSEGTRWRSMSALPSITRSEPSLKSLETAALANRQDLAAEAETLAALEMGYSLTRKTRYFPALNLGVETERESEGTRLTGPTLDVELPIFNFGQGRIRKAGAEVAKAKATVEAMQLEVANDVRAALQQVQHARQVYDQTAGVILPQRQKILAESLLQYNAMQVSNFALLEAKANEIEAQQAQIEALRDFWIARAELERAAGGSLTVVKPSSARKTAKASGAHVH